MEEHPIRIKTTITVPSSWLEKIIEYMNEKGFQDYAELFRHLIRETIIEKKQNTTANIAIRLLKHVLQAGAAADEFLEFIEKRDPQLVDEIIELQKQGLLGWWLDGEC